MSLLIAATDFSDIGDNAVHYACGFASRLHAQLIIIHSFMLPVIFSDVPMPVAVMDDAQYDAETHMTALVDKLKTTYPGVDIIGQVAYGSFIDNINDFTGDDVPPLMIIVGNSSAAEAGTWPDSTLIDTFKKIKFPVLAIPANMSYEPVQKLCFAFDNMHARNHTAISQLRDIMEPLHAELHVLNVQEEAAMQDNKTEIDAEVHTLLSGTNTHFHFMYNKGDIDGGIASFTRENNMDMLVMIPRKHSFFEGLFHKSHTKNIAHHCDIPLLVLHEAAE